MSVVELGLLIDIDMCFFLPDDYQIANKGWFCRLKSKDKSYGIHWLPQKIVTENTKKSYIRSLWEKLIEDTSISKMKKMNIIVVLYTTEHFVHFQKNIGNRNKNNIDISF